MKKILLLIVCSVFTVNTFAQSRKIVNITCDGGDAQTQTAFLKKMFDAIGPNREFVPSLGTRASLQLQARIASMAGRQYVIGELHETATSNLMKSTNSYFFKAADELDEICDKMADELIGKKDEDKYPTEIVDSESVAEVVSKADKKSRKGDGNTSDEKIRQSGKNYYLGTSEDRMTAKEYENFLEDHCLEAFDKYRKGKSQAKWGKICLWGGVGLFVVGFAMMNSEVEDYYYDGYYGGYNTYNTYNNFDGLYQMLMSLGSASIVTSIPLLIIGSNNKKASVEIYNRSCRSTKPKASLNFNVKNNGIGLALNF